MKKYIVTQNGFVVVHGEPCELKVGQSVSKLVYDNYPNFVSEVEIGFDKLPEIKVPVEEQTSEPIVIEEELKEQIVEETVEEELVVVEEKRRGRPKADK